MRMTQWVGMVMLCCSLTLSCLAKQNCDSCGYAWNKADTPYCLGCGSSLAKQVKCKACGYLNAPHDAYCLECAAKLADQEPMPELKVVPKNTLPAAEPLKAEDTDYVHLEGLTIDQKRQSIWIQEKEMSKRKREGSRWTGGVEAKAVKELQQKGFFLFCYQELNNTGAHYGLYEVAKGLPLTRAKPVVVPFASKVEVLRTEMVDYEEPQRTSLTYVYIKVISPEGFINYDGRPVKFEELQGYAIKKNVRILTPDS